jgi:hypothetical protein
MIFPYNFIGYLHKKLIGNFTKILLAADEKQIAEWGHASFGGMSPIGMVILIA